MSKRGWAFKNTRMRKWIADFLIEKGEPQSTGAIFDWQLSKRGALTRAALGNYLAKDPQFVKCGEVYIESLYYTQMLWTHASLLEVEEDIS